MEILKYIYKNIEFIFNYYPIQNMAIKIKNILGIIYIKTNYKIINFEKNRIMFELCDLCKNDYYSNYFYLLKQLTTINPNNINYTTFCKFVEKLNKNHIIKIIKIKDSNKIVGSVQYLLKKNLFIILEKLHI